MNKYSSPIHEFFRCCSLDSRCCFHGFGEEYRCSGPAADRFEKLFAKRTAARLASARSLVRDRFGMRVLVLELLVMSALSAGRRFDASHHHLRRRS
jgi:hypothetical protein